MPWNPEVYNQFKNIRYQPFFDLMNLITSDYLQSAVDVGCGTGEQTSILSNKFEHTSFTGIDASAEMLAESKKFVNEKLHYIQITTEAFIESSSTWDLVFSNAALQWSNNHETLFPKLINKLNLNGQFAVQMPFQKENVLNNILLELVSEEPFKSLLGGFRRDSPLLQIDEYAGIMFQYGLKDLNIFLKVYPIIAEDEIHLYNFISGTTVVPYLDRLDAQSQEVFKTAFIKRIKEYFQTFPAIYSFKRLLLYGVKK